MIFLPDMMWGFIACSWCLFSAFFITFPSIDRMLFIIFGVRGIFTCECDVYDVYCLGHGVMSPNVNKWMDYVTKSCLLLSMHVSFDPKSGGFVLYLKYRTILHPPCCSWWLTWGWAAFTGIGILKLNVGQWMLFCSLGTKSKMRKDCVSLFVRPVPSVSFQRGDWLCDVMIR